MKAQNFLQAGLDAMQQRAATYDKPEGERSMSATVEAFRAITGHDLSEEAGWLFMAILKAVRSQQGNYSADSYIDGAAYFGLAGEAAHRARAGVSAEAFQINNWTVTCDDRMDIIGQNGPTGEHYQSTGMCHDCSAEHCPCVAR